MKHATDDLSDALKMGGQSGFESSSGFVLIGLALDEARNVGLCIRP
jgi:hypothetical protein